MLCVERNTLKGHSHMLCQWTDQFQQKTDSNSSKKSKVWPSVILLGIRWNKTQNWKCHLPAKMYIWCNFRYYHIQKQFSHLVLHNFVNVQVTPTMQPPFCFRWTINYKQKHSLTLNAFSIRFLWMLTALAANVDEELWKHKKEKNFQLGCYETSVFSWCLHPIHHSQMKKHSSVLLVCLLWKFIHYFERNIFSFRKLAFLQCPGVLLLLVQKLHR